MNGYRILRVRSDVRNVLTVTWDVESRTQNVITIGMLTELERLVGELEDVPSLRGVIFRSGKEGSFLAGADLRELRSLRSKARAREIVMRGQRLLDRIERLGVPTFAVIHGPCMGGGLEFALSCTYRIACDDEQTRFGLPEVELGLLPAWGGTQRLPAIIGLSKALPLILKGKRIAPSEAFKLGLVDRIWSPDLFGSESERFVTDHLERSGVIRQRRPVVSLVDRTRLGQYWVLRSARRQSFPFASHYPAPTEALKAVETGLHRGRAEGQSQEKEAFANLLFSPTCRNLLTTFFDRERARKLDTWVPDHLSYVSVPRCVAVIGAGAMGAGIAQLAALRGLSVVLYDVDRSRLDDAMQRIEDLTLQAAERGVLERGDVESRLSRIQTSDDRHLPATIDIAIEAVPENEQLKQEVFDWLDHGLHPEALIVSNTSSLSIERLARATGRRSRVAGLHFFNPVHRMGLVEIVRTRDHSEYTIATLVELVRKLGKVPIVVNDRPGFLVNRILFPYLEEAVRLMCEGLSADRIDGSMRSFGMPMGPLELLDQVGLDVGCDIARVLSPLRAESGPIAELLSFMVEQGATGKKTGCGFYAYHSDGRRGIALPWQREWSRSGSPFLQSQPAPNDGDTMSSNVQLRLVLALVNEAARCIEEEVVAESWMVDLAMVMGTGFAPFRGGPLHLADQCGESQIVEHLERLAAECGPRYAPSQLLRAMGRRDGMFHPEWQHEPLAIATECEAATA